jgi:hypothetical protein
MAMKETVRSLRVFFIVIGVAAGLNKLSAVLTWFRAGQLPPLVPGMFIAVDLAVAIGFVIAGITLRSALPNGARWIKRLITVPRVFRGAEIIYLVTGAPSPFERGWGLRLTLGIFLPLYLYVSVRRLANEATGGLAPANVVNSRQ